MYNVDFLKAYVVCYIDEIYLDEVGIENVVIQVMLGLAVSFAGSIIAVWVMKKTKWLEFFLYPNKFIKL